MVRWARGSLLLIGLVLAAGLVAGPARAADDADVLIDDAGPGFQQGQDTGGRLGATTRTFRHPNGQLQLTLVPLSDGLDVRQMFALTSQLAVPDLVQIDVPDLPLARWFAEPGVDPERSAVVVVTFASRSSIFTAAVFSDDLAALSPLATARDVARRQLDRAGGPPSEVEASPQEGIDPTLVAVLPADPDARFGLTAPATVGGRDELPPGLGIDAEVTTFLNNRSRTAVRLWADPNTGLSAAVSVTEYPYDVFAAAALGAMADNEDVVVRPFAGLDDVPDVVTFVGQGQKEGQVGSSLRRGRLSVLVLVQAGQVGLQEAAAVVVDLTRQVHARLPAGATAVYRFPTPPSTIAGLALTSVAVTAAGAAAIGVGRARAWRLRRSGAEQQASPVATVGSGQGDSSATTGGADVVSLDDDARELRRRGAVVVVAQLIALNVIVVSLAGDFGWTGVVIAVFGLAGGLGFTSWWRRRELGAIGPQGAGAPFILPRPAGALVGIVSLAVLGIGVSYAFKGLRYLILRPTLAQLRWSDLLGLSPRGVGVLFALGGLAVAALGGFLFRLARALGRADTRRLLAVDRRPPLLYLRSFADDTLPLATIASARRPFFELFSFRGRDPFEEAVAWELATYGPVVAVGRPGHSLASLGAAREHLTDDTWKDQVAQRMDDARAIAVATGETPGLHWEVAQIVAAGHLGKTVFVFPPVAREAVARRWKFTAAALVAAGAEAHPLPADPALVHTACVAADGRVTVTIAGRRDEASYRTAVDRAMTGIAPAPAPSGPPAPAVQITPAGLAGPSRPPVPSAPGTWGPPSPPVSAD